MTDAEILKRAILKAYPDKKYQLGRMLTKGHFPDDLLEYAKCQIERDGGYRLVFNHDFAKAFWGDGWVCSKCLQPITTKGCMFFNSRHSHTVISWQVYLQQMVLEPEPLKYLEKYL